MPRRRLIEQEKKLEAYRKRLLGELPSQQDSNLLALSNLQLQTQSLMDARRARPGQVAARRSPAGRHAIARIRAGQRGRFRQRHGERRHDGAAARRGARAALGQLELRLKPEHPDVGRMKRVIRDLEKRAEAEALEAPLSPDARRPARRRSSPSAPRCAHWNRRPRRCGAAIALKERGRAAASWNGEHLSGARRCRAVARDRADRADARLRHRAETCTRRCWPRTKSRSWPSTSRAVRSASSSGFSTPRGYPNGRSARTGCG